MLALGASLPATAGDTFLLLGPGFGGLRRSPHKLFASFELQQTLGRGPLGLWGTVDIGGDEQYAGFGLRLTWPLGSDWTVCISSGPGWYSNIRPFNLGSHLEFRSSLTLMRRFGERFRVGLSVSHYSNAGTGDHNPGAETVRFLFAIPIVRD